MSAADDSQPPPDDSAERRAAERVPVLWSVDCETEETFLYASIMNVSEMGIFVATTQPQAVGTEMTLRFSPPDAQDDFVLQGRVQWINELRLDGDNLNPGMGIRFIDLKPDERERLVEMVKTIAYLRGDPVPPLH